VSQLSWDEVKDLLHPDKGTLPDVMIPTASLTDWQTVLDLVRSKGWAHQYSENGRHVGLPTAELIFGRKSDVGVELRVWPVPDLLAIFRFYVTSEIDFDVDLRELQSQARLDALCAFFRVVGRSLRKPVVMTFEGSDETPMIGYDVDLDRVVRLAPAPD
jgi:hypothetical protein